MKKIGINHHKGNIKRKADIKVKKAVLAYLERMLGRLPHISEFITSNS